MTNQISKQKNTKKIVLVVEDDTNVQKIYKSLLTQEGYEVSITDTVDKACDLLSKNMVDLYNLKGREEEIIIFKKINEINKKIQDIKNGRKN